MYAQRRGQHFNDNEARDANANLMKSKRKQNLLAQLQEKEELLKQYLNPRGIGMRGQTVPQRDIEMLRQQIDLIHQQLEDNSEVQSNYAPTPSSAQRQPEVQVHQQLPQRELQAPPMLPSTMSHASTGSTRRDEVWHAKYQLWLQRNQGRAPERAAQPTQQNFGMPPLHPQQNVPQPYQQPQQQQQQAQFGRRATPPTMDMMRQQQQQPQQQQQQQQQQQPQQTMISNSNANDNVGRSQPTAANASYGRRASGNRPW